MFDMFVVIVGDCGLYCVCLCVSVWCWLYCLFALLIVGCRFVGVLLVLF